MDDCEDEDMDKNVDLYKPCNSKQQMDDNVKFDALYVTGIEDISLDDFPTSESTRLMSNEEQEKQLLGTSLFF